MITCYSPVAPTTRGLLLDNFATKRIRIPITDNSAKCSFRQSDGQTRG